MNPRTLVAHSITMVLADGKSLAEGLASAAVRSLPPGDRALVQEMSYGVLRWLTPLEAIAKGLLKKPFKPRDADLRCLLLAGLYQLIYMRTPDHAVVSQTVEAVRELKKPWATGLINGVLRTYLRDPQRWQALAEGEPVLFSHPHWLREALQQAWPDYWRAILLANNAKPPLWLRINVGRQSTESYLSRLRDANLACISNRHAPAAVLLEHPLGVNEIPGFNQGQVSVQDAAAQLSANLLQVQAGDRVLDACAAPGGKTGHLLEAYPQAGCLWALDQEPTRISLIQANLERLGLRAELRVADASEPATWWDGQPFERILLDAPCSATGVIRRHPDIKWLRRPTDIPALAAQQQHLLERLWPLLSPGGRLLYVTCSVLPEENEQQIARFLPNHKDAREQPIQAQWGHPCLHGCQILPGEDGMDGFYYACVEKKFEYS